MPPAKAIAHARRLRRAMTLPEVLLWRHLRMAPVKFRRQHPVGPYVLDFYCASAKTGIEVDGAAHDMGAHPARDAEREVWLRQRGIKVMRVPARAVLGALEVTVEGIVRVCGG
ncbi:endonuclease domain-containing protein [Novosphingobium soli]|uniref:Endonuclease domain-containing protein n=1 Tax=Novosphingobium soli TaxID=574956 RepID=A0ABV6CXF8_9SPHN